MSRSSDLLIEKLGTMHYGHDTDSDQGQNTLSIIGFAVRDAELSNEQLSDRLWSQLLILFDHISFKNSEGDVAL